jgi:hypothetical protein
MNNKDRFLLYTANDGAVKVDVLYKEETVWLSRRLWPGFSAFKSRQSTST